MSSAKLQISAPLEAGRPLLDSKALPSRLTDALQYVSSRLTRKQFHLTMIVVRKSPRVARSQASPSSPARSPSLFGESDASSTVGSASASDASSNSSAYSLSRTRWPGLPSSPKDFNSSPTSPTGQNVWGISLMHACSVSPKAEKVLRSSIQKAVKKFDIGSGWLSSQSLTTEITCPNTNDLIRRSLVQNNVLFSSESLTLLSLDHVYTFKCLLHFYSRSHAASDLTAAVDQLRYLVLNNNCRKITKSHISRTYEWVKVSLATLIEVNEGYKATYGGNQRLGGIEVQEQARKSPAQLTTANLQQLKANLPQIKTSFPSFQTFRFIIDGNISPGGNVSPIVQNPVYREVQFGESAQGFEGMQKGAAIATC